MILTKVDIRDFRSHKSTTVNFDKGISVIIGENGSGKTSILESINFALFKQKPNASINMDDLIRRGTAKAEVSVTFIANGRTFRVTRGRKIGKAYGSALYSVDDDKTLAMGEDEITKGIENVLGLGGELFASAVYIKQGEIDKLVSEQAAKRKEHIGKLLGADELERAHQGTKDVIDTYKERAGALIHLPEALKETEKTITEKKGSIKNLKEELGKSSKISASVKKELKETQKALRGLEQLKNLEYEETIQKNEIEKHREKIGEIEKNETELKETQKYHERYTAINKKLESLGEKRATLRKLQERDEGLKRELSKVDEGILRLENSIADNFERYGRILGKKFTDFEKISGYHIKAQEKLESSKEKTSKKIGRANSKISGNHGKNREIEKAVHELGRAGAKCPVCRGPLDKKHKEELLEEYSQKIKKNTADIEKWESALEKLKEDRQKIGRSLQDVQNINLALLKLQIVDRASLEKSVLEIKSDIKTNENALKDLSGIEKLLKENERKKSELEEDNVRYVTARNYLRRHLPEKEDLQASSKKIEKDILKLKKNIQKLGGPLDMQKFKRVKHKEGELQERFRDAKVTEGKLESDINHMKNEINDSKKLLTELKLKEKEREKLSKFLVLLKNIRDIFHKDALQRELRTKAMPLIERYTREIFDMFDLPYTDLELTDDFNVALFGPHGGESIDMLSGGERIASALALRIGIAKALSGSAMELIILDEPTIHLDSQRRQDLVEIIKKLSSIPQTIVVTHDKEFEQAADRLILVEKVSGISKVS